MDGRMNGRMRACVRSCVRQVCIVATGVVGDLCRALDKGILPYCQHIMGWLMVNLEGASINR